MNAKTAVIAGAGVMGASLAQVYALAGWNTILYNRSEEGLRRAEKLIAINQSVMVQEELVSAESSCSLTQRIQMTTDKSAFPSADIVVENITENMESKQIFWTEVSRLVRRDTLLATNTSGLKITELAKSCQYPDRFMGQHWLNPPHLLPLCEIVTGEQTSQEYIQRMKKLVQELGKQPVVVKDINGFLINRIQFAVLREALHIVEMGAASFEDIDTVLKSGMGLRYAALGPFGIADFGGLDTFHHIDSYLNASLSDSKEGSPLLKELVEAGKLGVKSGAGFYDYTGDRAQNAIQARDRMYIALAKCLYF